MPGRNRREVALSAAVAPACAVLAGALAWAGLSLPERPPALAEEAASAMADIGVGNPVTAVLLDFRSWDTLLEVAVLVLALTSVWALRRVVGVRRPARPRSGGAPPGGPVLLGLARLVAPAAVVTAGYLWWAGSHAPGGAFQGGAVLGAAGVLLILSGRLEPRRLVEGAARAAAVAGLLGFLILGATTIAVGRAFLDMPTAATYGTILAVEGLLTLSIAAVLTSLFADALKLGGKSGEAEHRW